MMRTHPGLLLVSHVDDLRAALRDHRRAGRSIGFVPTMGALHDGHAELIRTARHECDVVVTSCFVNPTQFRPGEDLAQYPRTPEEDLHVARRAGTDLLWRPTVHDVYGGDDLGDAVSVTVGEIGTVLEGRSRPGHFDGVATVVVRLLAAVGPDRLYLGEKDFQQVVVLRRVVEELLLPVQVRTVPTVREDDGLARSSRNVFLDPAARRAARAIPAALDVARRLVESGSHDPHAVRAAAADVLERADGVDVDYVELVDARSLAPIDAFHADRPSVLLVAARIGTTRLLDNLPIRIAEVRP